MKKLGTVILTLLAVVSLNCMTAEAASTSWDLRYIPHAGSSANKTSWGKFVITTSTKTTMKVNEVGGGAKIFVYTDNGISSLFSGAGSTTITTTKSGVKIYGGVMYNEKGSYYNYPKGTFVY